MTKIEIIKVLRQRHRISVALARQAAEKFGTDLDAAEQWIQENWKPGKSQAQMNGAIFSYLHPADHPRHGSLVELRCGTDFVARTDDFKALGRELALQAVGGPGEGRLEDQVYIRDPRRKVQDLINEYSQRLGETLLVTRWMKWSVGGTPPD